MNQPSTDQKTRQGAGADSPSVFLLILVFLSGALALIYEILWMRRFSAIFGAATPAVAATLAAVFLGFTLGGFVIGKWASRIGRPVRAYALLELLIGLGALLLEPLLGIYDRLYPALYHALSGSPAGFALLKTLLAMAGLLLPTFCMGGTVPLLGQTDNGAWRHLGISAGALYAVNTVGAAVGAFSVPFVWLPHFTARATYSICIAGNLTIAVIAWALDRGRTVPTSISNEQRQKPTPRSATSLSLQSIYVFTAMSGVLLFILQVVWSRMFAQVHENSIYSFSIVVAVLLAGLGLGAALPRWLLSGGWSPLRILGVAWLAGGALVVLTPSAFTFLTNGLAFINSKGGLSVLGLRVLGLTLPTVFLPSLLTGMAMPLLMELAGQMSVESSGRVLGRLLAINTAASICGSLLAAFLLPQTLGLWLTLVLAGIIFIAAGDWILGPGKVRRLATALALVFAMTLLNPAALPRTDYRAKEGERLVHLKESSHGIVAVVEKGPSRRIKLNNYYVLGGTASTGDERWQGHLPLLLHAAPRRVAFLGLGTGITAGAALLHPIDQITVIELVPEVVAAARDYFAEANLRVLEAPNVRVLTEDARNYLLAAPGQFDVIVGDLFVPWHRGEASLYTADHFRVTRRALATNGIYCQWLPLFQLSEEEFNIVTATFIDVFPNTTLWRGDFAPGEPAIALVGHSDAHARVDAAVVAQRIRQMKLDPANPSLAHPAGFWMFLAGAVDGKDPRFGSARRNRENEPWLEILGPRTQVSGLDRGARTFVGASLENYLNELRARPTAGTALASLTTDVLTWRSVGGDLGAASILMAGGQYPEARQRLEQATQKLPAELRRFFEPMTAP